MPSSQIEARIVELEAKVSLSEDLLEVLNQTIYRQQQLIDQLQRELVSIRAQLREESPDPIRQPRDEIPPHY